MQPSVYRISLDVHDAHSGVCLDMKRQDTARQISITLTDGGFPYQISEECYAVFAATKADGKRLLHQCSVHGNTIQYEVRPQTTAAVGLCECEIKLYGAGDMLLFSPGFSILVSENALADEEDLVSEDELDELTHLISEATTVITEGKAINADARELVDEMEANRETLNRQITDTAEHAATAKKMALLAAQDRQAASNAANLATSKAKESENSANDAKISEENAARSASSAANMANGALAAQKAAEEAAKRAENSSGITDDQLEAAVAAKLQEAKDTGAFDGEDGKDGATFTPFIVNGYLNWRNDGGRPNPGSIYIIGADGKSAYAYAREGGYTGTKEEFAEMLASGTGGLPLPPAAAVGQFIVVSAVDDNGKVTGTEAVNAPALLDVEGVAF